MSDHDQLLRTIQTIHADGLESETASSALALASRLLGSVGATMEVIDKPARRHLGMWSYGIRPSHKRDYIDHYAAISPRIRFGNRQSAGSVLWDYQMLDERGLARDEFYADFLPHVGIRYFAAAMLTQTADEAAVFAVHRTPRQGHVDKREIALMRLLTPHLQQAHDMATRLKGAAQRADTFERALDWLTDGAALLRKDGRLLYANDAFQAIARRQDGVRIARGMVELTAPDAHASLAAALTAIVRLGAGDPAALAHTDFPAPRAGGGPAYVVSLRPLIGKQTSGRSRDAIAILFVRDPLGRNAAATRMLRALYSLTEAEANLALAIQAGLSLPDYARQARVSLNTIYTHLRRIKDKTGCHRMAALNKLLRELQVPLRHD